MTPSRAEQVGSEHVEAQFQAILERVLRAYHRDEGHGGASWVGLNVLDPTLVPVAREACLEADNMPSDLEVLRVLDSEAMQLLGEGYHVIALAEPTKRFITPAGSTRDRAPSASGSSNERGVNGALMTSTPFFMPNCVHSSSTRSAG